MIDMFAIGPPGKDITGGCCEDTGGADVAGRCVFPEEAAEVREVAEP